MGGFFRQIIRDLRLVFTPDAAPAPPDAGIDASIAELVRSIEQSLSLARNAASSAMRESNLGIARMNFNALRALTGDFTHDVTPAVLQLRAAFERVEPWELSPEDSAGNSPANRDT